MDIHDITAQSRAPLTDWKDGDAIDLSTPDGLETLFDLLVRAECSPATLAKRAGISITELARIVTRPENLRTMRKLTQMYGIYRAAMAARFKTHALVELTKSAECPHASTLPEARGMDVARKACVDLLRFKEQSPLLAVPPRRRKRTRRASDASADGSSHARLSPEGRGDLISTATPVAPALNGSATHTNGATTRVTSPARFQSRRPP